MCFESPHRKTGAEKAGQFGKGGRECVYCTSFTALTPTALLSPGRQFQFEFLCMEDNVTASGSGIPPPASGT